MVRTYLGVRSEELLGKGEHHLLEVGEADVLINVESLYLVEETVSTGCDCLIAIYPTRTDDSDRGLLLLHYACLYA